MGDRLVWTGDCQLVRGGLFMPDGLRLADEGRFHIPERVADRLIVSLDVIVQKLSGVVSFFKVGLGLQMADGFDRLVSQIIAKGNDVFWDAKMLDIPNTVRQAVATAAARGIRFVTVHFSESVVKAAIEGRSDYNLSIFTVTVLTSLDDAGARNLGANSIKELIEIRAREALDFGCDGVIAAPRDDLEGIKAMAAARGKQFLIATPGIRPHGSPVDDHARSADPASAISAGADYLIVGRPIIEADDPVKVAREIIDEMERANYGRSP
jgi:orotidine-5'-phosphate decarboxylase